MEKILQTGKPPEKCTICIEQGEKLFLIQQEIDRQANNPLLWPNPKRVRRDDGTEIEIPLSDNESALKDALGKLHQMVEEITCQ